MDGKGGVYVDAVKAFVRSTVCRQVLLFSRTVTLRDINKAGRVNGRRITGVGGG